MNDSEDLGKERCLVDGVELPDGYGISIKRDEDLLSFDVLAPLEVVGAVRPATLVAWLTIRREDGTYDPVRRMDPRSRIVFWDYRGHRVEFCDGVGTIIVKKDLTDKQRGLGGWETIKSWREARASLFGILLLAVALVALIVLWATGLVR